MESIVRNTKLTASEVAKQLQGAGHKVSPENVRVKRHRLGIKSDNPVGRPRKHPTQTEGEAHSG